MTVTHSTGALNIAGGNLGIASSTPNATLSIDGNIVNKFIELTDGTTITIDQSTSNNFFVTLGGNRTLAFTNIDVGQKITVVFLQDSTGTRLFPTLPTEATCLGGNPTFRTGAGNMDVVVFFTATSSATITCIP